MFGTITLFLVALVVCLALSPRVLDVTRGGTDTHFQDTTPNTTIRSVDDKVFFLQAKIAPFMTMLKKIKRGQKNRFQNQMFEWPEQDMGTPWTNATVGEIAGASPINITAGSGRMWSINDIMWNPATGEQMLVTATPAADAVAVTRGYGETATAAIAAGQMLVLLNPAFMEGDVAGVAKSQNTTMPFNYQQIFRHLAECTKSDAKADRYDNKNPKMIIERNKTMIRHMEGIERQYLFGERNRDLTGTHPRNTTRGFRRFITSNVYDCLGAFTRVKFNAFLEPVLRYGVGNHVLFCSTELVEALITEIFTTANYNVDYATKEFGLDIGKYLSPYGKISIVYHQILSQVLPGYGYLMDLDCIEEKTARPTRISYGVQLPSTDIFQDEILTEAGLQVALEKRHGIIHNV